MDPRFKTIHFQNPKNISQALAFINRVSNTSEDGKNYDDSQPNASKQLSEKAVPYGVFINI